MLTMDLALGLDPIDEILARHGIDCYLWESLQSNLTFRRELMVLRKELAESGTTFKRKAALQAETYLTEMHTLMQDPSVPPPTKVDIFKTLAKLGELEPKDSSKLKGEGSNVPQFAIQINIG
jgi:hypothetical protein